MADKRKNQGQTSGYGGSFRSTIALSALGILSAVVLRLFWPGTTVTIVQTTSGRFRGQIASGTSGVSEYLGIPYAKPPVGQLRWAPAEPCVAASDAAVIDATRFGHSCPSKVVPFNFTGNIDITPHGKDILISMLTQTGVTYSEECLTLNVWTKRQTGERKKAVLFWIYGGGYRTGSTDNPGYNGKYIADHEDVVVVSANYRVNIFGFPGNPRTRNNLGLLDVRLAVEWTRDNIAAFGGDPDRIIIFGESAGGSAVDYYSYAWASDPIVAGFIAQSGTVFSPDSQADPSKSAGSWFNVTGNLGCGDADSDPDAVLDCMRSKDWQSIQEAIPSGQGLASVTGGFGPTIDELVVFSDYAARSAGGNVTKKPLLIGSNDNEQGLFQITLGLRNVTVPDAEWDALALAIFTCSSAARALASVVNQIPTWRYRWFGDFPNMKLAEGSRGAWHGSEIPVIFGTDLDIQSRVGRTAAQEQITSYVRGAWAAFAKDPVDGLTNYGLPRYAPSEATLLRLAYNNQSGPHAVLPSKYDEGCTVPTILTELLVELGLA